VIDSRNLLALENLRVRFTRRSGATHAVRGVNLTVAPGEVVAVVGESGSGKSVMLRTLLGLLPPTARVSGRAEIAGTAADLADGLELRRFRGKFAGMVFQDPLGSLDPMAPIGRQLEDAVVAQRGVARPAARAIALSLLDRVHLAGAAARYEALPHEFSGGQRQRIGIAMALAGEPRLLLADEPTTALDVSVQAQILALMRELCADSGMGLVLVTHDMGVAREMADRVAVMYAGRIVEEGAASPVLDAPRHPYTRSLLSSYAGVRHGSRPLPSLPGTPPRLDAEPSGCAFFARCAAAAERCRLAPPPTVAAAGRRYECILETEPA
jgi:peptide/nickel transport system ATP-binding protein